MSIRELERVLLDQKEELDVLRSKAFCHRDEERLLNLDSTLAQVVIGVRRSGKSTLCFNALEKANVRYAYVNFDDENLYDLTAKDMNDVLQVLYSIYGDFTHLFLDEIQNIDGWHLFVNRMLRKGIRILLTGEVAAYAFFEVHGGKRVIFNNAGYRDQIVKSDCTRRF